MEAIVLAVFLAWMDCKQFEGSPFGIFDSLHLSQVILKMLKQKSTKSCGTVTIFKARAFFDAINFSGTFLGSFDTSHLSSPAHFFFFFASENAHSWWRRMVKTGEG